MSKLDDALDILTNYTGMFLPEKFGSIQSAKDELVQLRHNVYINLLKAAAMVDAVRGKCELQPMNDGYLPEIEEAKQLRADLTQAQEAVEVLRHGMERAEQTIRNMGMAFPAGDDYHEIALNEIHNIYNDLESTAWLAAHQEVKG